MNVDGACLARICEAPHVLEQSVTREDHAGLPAECFEELELLRAKRDRALAHEDLVPRRVNTDVADAQDAPAAGHARRAAQDRSHAGHELARIERLREVVIHPRIESRDPLSVLGARGEGDHRCVRAAAQLVEELDPVRIGQAEVEDDQRRFHLVEQRTRALAGGRVLDDVSGVAQVERDELRDRRIVLDDDDPRGTAHRPSISSGIVRAVALKLATVLAHPDDETFGTGGTLIRYARDGIEVHSLCLTQGEKGWAGVDDKIVPRELVGPTRAQELAEAGRRMGLASVTCLRYPDGGLADVNEEWVVRDIVRWLRLVRPEVVIIWGPDGGYGHPDHIAAGERALKAIELAGVQRHEPELGAHWHAKRCYRFVASAELIDRLSSLMPAFAQYIETLAVKPERWTRDRLGAVIDIGAVLDAKVHAMDAHQTQAPDLRMWETARAKLPEIFTDETFIREYPEPGGPPLETDLFAGLRES